MRELLSPKVLQAERETVSEIVEGQTYKGEDG